MFFVKINMHIYLATPNAEQALQAAEEELHVNLESICDPRKNKELLEEKKVFLIDTFSTFIPPITDRYDQIAYERGGILAYLRTKEPRAGFKETLEHFKHKTVGIHTDSLSNKEYQSINKQWQLQNVHFFGTEYFTYDLFGEWTGQGMKDFKKMLGSLNAEPQQTLIIGDGWSDMKPAYKQDIDILLVPSYVREPDFDFRSLYT
jgi:phosphoglycolate phosphatase-like HAD superfamily hydrolase